KEPLLEFKISSMDIYLINGNFQIGTNGDLKILDEEKTLKQDIYNRLRTITGSHFLHKNYGVDLYQFLNSNQDELTLLELINHIQDQLEEDPRIYEAEVQLNRKPDEITLLIHITPLQNSPFSLEIGKQSIKFIARAK
ncbi:MAG: DUF2634 domain-containing protein, partial [Bacteroidetes bacterium]